MGHAGSHAYFHRSQNLSRLNSNWKFTLMRGRLLRQQLMARAAECQVRGYAVIYDAQPRSTKDLTFS